MIPPSVIWGLLTVCGALSALLVWASIRYAHRRGLMDLPGRRRSHVVPTPRGAGVGIAVSVFVGLVAAASAGWLPVSWILGSIPLMLVAGIGFWDDHRPLPAVPRLVVHLFAGCVLALMLAPAWQAPLPALTFVLVASVGVAAIVNVWNFMDGINGLAAVHALWIASVLGVTLFLEGQAGAGLVAGLFAASLLGFLPFNLPRARIFLGDVGSGFLGAAIGTLLLLAWRNGVLGLPAMMLLPSAFLIDAGATLLLRMAAGRRWYTAHRSHLYQWLVRRGRSHPRIVLMSLAWNLPTTMLALYLGARQDLVAFALALVVLLAGGLGWFGMRRQLRREAAGLA